MKQTTHTTIQMEIAERAAQCWELAAEHWGVIDHYGMPSHRFDLKGKTGGQYRYSRALSPEDPDCVREYRWNLEAAHKYRGPYLAETVPHEVAHAVVHILRWHGHVPRREGPHGRTWQRVMRSLGVNPERTHNYDLTPARVTRKYPYRCSCRDHYLGGQRHRRAQQGGLYRCNACRGLLRYVGE